MGVVRGILLALLAAGFKGVVRGGQPPASNIKADEEIVFFPTMAWSSPDGKWHVPIQGCVFEAEKRRLALALLRKNLQLRRVAVSEAEDVLLAERARLFMADHERRKRVVVQFGSERYAVGKSGPDGWFRGEVVLSPEQVDGLAAGSPGQTRAVSFQACLSPGDARVFAAKALLVAPAGLVVVSDIDDTIKHSQVLDRSALLRSTFLEPFKGVAGMSELYRGWARRGDVHFCYVSASPWQLFAPLSQFTISENFPNGTFHLRALRWDPRSVASLFQSPEKHKLSAIEPLLEKFPQRRFVLVGDSGEQDPEIYGALARKYPQRIAAIYIREVAASCDAERYASAFRGLDRSLWTCFREPSELAGGLEQRLMR